MKTFLAVCAILSVTFFADAKYEHKRPEKKERYKKEDIIPYRIAPGQQTVRSFCPPFYERTAEGCVLDETVEHEKKCERGALTPTGKCIMYQNVSYRCPTGFTRSENLSDKETACKRQSFHFGFYECPDGTPTSQHLECSVEKRTPAVPMCSGKNVNGLVTECVELVEVEPILNCPEGMQLRDGVCAKDVVYECIPDILCVGFDCLAPPPPPPAEYSAPKTEPPMVSLPTELKPIPRKEKKYKKGKKYYKKKYSKKGSEPHPNSLTVAADLHGLLKVLSDAEEIESWENGVWADEVDQSAIDSMLLHQEDLSDDSSDTIHGEILAEIIHEEDTSLAEEEVAETANVVKDDAEIDTEDVSAESKRALAKQKPDLKNPVSALELDAEQCKQTVLEGPIVTCPAGARMRVSRKHGKRCLAEKDRGISYGCLEGTYDALNNECVYQTKSDAPKVCPPNHSPCRAKKNGELKEICCNEQYAEPFSQCPSGYILNKRNCIRFEDPKESCPDGYSEHLLGCSRRVIREPITCVNEGCPDEGDL